MSDASRFRRHRKAHFLVMGVVATFLASFSSGSVAGTLNIPGTGDGLDILSALAAAYTADNPGTMVVVPPSTGSPGAIIALHADEAVLGRIARPLSETESGYGITSKPIVNIPSAFFVHPSVKVDTLTTAQIREAFPSSPGRILSPCMERGTTFVSTRK